MDNPPWTVLGWVIYFNSADRLAPTANSRLKLIKDTFVVDAPEPTPLGPLVEEVDYYIDELGRYVFTEEYHRKRGYCCRNGCKHCPYGFHKGED